MTTAQTQKQAILAYVRKHHFITRMDAFRSCGCCNLWARISELEDDGHRFDRRRVRTRGGKHVYQYWLRTAGRKAVVELLGMQADAVKLRRSRYE